MTINKAINALLNEKTIKEVINHYKISGGTSSEIYIIEDIENRKIVVKFNSRNVIKYESIFLQKYRCVDIFPNIISIDKNFDYLVYEYIEGTTNNIKLDKQLLNTLKNITLSYKVYNKAGYGWLDELTSWDEFIINRVNESKKLIENENLLIDIENIEKYISKVSTYKFDKYLLHGDFGLHNFIGDNGKLKAIIDPTPVVGDRIYDLIYALCSKVEFLENIKIDEVYDILFELGYSKDKVDNYLKVILYIRIGTCIKYHKEDLKRYLEVYKSISSN